MTTIHTNPGALVAQATLRTISDNLDKVSKQVQTGYKVADAKDDASTFAVAQGLRNNVASLGAVQQGLSGAIGLAEVGLAGGTAVSNLFTQIKAKITQLADGTVQGTTRTTYSADLAALATQAKSLISQASFNGTKLLTNNTVNNFIADVNGGVVPIAGVDISAAAAAFSTSASAAITSTAAQAQLSVVASKLNAFINVTNTALSSISSALRSVESQNNFTKSISDATEKGLGALVDADLAKASSRLQALQAQQQLATQAITIANQAPQTLLALFKQ